MTSYANGAEVNPDAFYSDFEIKEGWTVHLDVVTPIMKTLTVRGELIFTQDPAGPIGLHAYYVDVKGYAPPPPRRGTFKHQLPLTFKVATHTQVRGQDSHWDERGAVRLEAHRLH